MSHRTGTIPHRNGYRRNRRTFVTAAVGGIALLVLASCTGKLSERSGPGQGTVPPTTPTVPQTGDGRVPPGEKPKVALLLPMSGKFEKLGTALRQSAELALFEIADKNFELTPIDTGGTPEGARRAAAQAKESGAHLVLGPLFSGSVKAVKEELAGTDINIIAFSTDETVAGDNVFLMGFLVKPQVSRILEYASQQGMKRIAIAAPEGPYGDAVIAAFNEAAQSKGVTVSATLLYPTETEKMSTAFRGFTGYNVRAAPLLRILNRTRGKTDIESRRARARARRDIKVPPPTWDAVLIADGGPRLLLAASLLAYYDVSPDKVQYLGTGQWDDLAVTKEQSLKGGWFSAPPPSARAKFEAKYKSQFKSDPPRIATLAYDAVALAAVMARAEGGANFGREAILSPNGFSGIDGIFRFLETGVSQRGLAVLEISEGEFRMIGEPPKSFEIATE